MNTLYFCSLWKGSWLGLVQANRARGAGWEWSGDKGEHFTWGILSLWLPDFFCPCWEPVCRLRILNSVNASSEHFCGTSSKKTTWLKKLVIIINFATFFYLSELAGLLVTGLKTYNSSKTRYIRYTRPTLNAVNRSNTLHTKWPPEEKKIPVKVFIAQLKFPHSWWNIL